MSYIKSLHFAYVLFFQHFLGCRFLHLLLSITSSHILTLIRLSSGLITASLPSETEWRNYYKKRKAILHSRMEKKNKTDSFKGLKAGIREKITQNTSQSQEQYFHFTSEAWTRIKTQLTSRILFIKAFISGQMPIVSNCPHLHRKGSACSCSAHLPLLPGPKEGVHITLRTFSSLLLLTR